MIPPGTHVHGIADAPLHARRNLNTGVVLGCRTIEQRDGTTVDVVDLQLDDGPLCMVPESLLNTD